MGSTFRPTHNFSWLQVKGDVEFICERDTLWQLSSKIVTPQYETNTKQSAFPAPLLVSKTDTKLKKEHVHGTDTLELIVIGHVQVEGKTILLKTRSLTSTTPLHSVDSKHKDLVSFLKSHLQKTVRQNKATLAVQTAKWLLAIAPLELLRRLPIIIVEDVFLVIHVIGPLIWFMMAYPFRGLDLEDQSWILGVIQEITQQPWRDFPILPSPKADWKPDLLHPILGPLVIRQAYGGMECDKELLRNVYYTWQNRLDKTALTVNWGHKFIKKISQNISVIIPIDLSTVKPLLEKDCLIEAMDHHCSPILTLLPKSIKDARRMLWECSSSINSHFSVDLSFCPIKPYWTENQRLAIKSTQKYLLKKLFQCNTAQ
jgi:hypothetical protein